MRARTALVLCPLFLVACSFEDISALVSSAEVDGPDAISVSDYYDHVFVADGTDLLILDADGDLVDDAETGAPIVALSNDPDLHDHTWALEADGKLRLWNAKGFWDASNSTTLGLDSGGRAQLSAYCDVARTDEGFFVTTWEGTTAASKTLLWYGTLAGDWSHVQLDSDSYHGCGEVAWDPEEEVAVVRIDETFTSYDTDLDEVDSVELEPYAEGDFRDHRVFDGRVVATGIVDGITWVASYDLGSGELDGLYPTELDASTALDTSHVLYGGDIEVFVAGEASSDGASVKVLSMQ